MLSDSQLKLIADILVATGQVILASLVIPYFTGVASFALLTSGLILTLAPWSLALLITKDSVKL